MVGLAGECKDEVVGCDVRRRVIKMELILVNDMVFVVELEEEGEEEEEEKKEEEEEEEEELTRALDTGRRGEEEVTMKKRDGVDEGEYYYKECADEEEKSYIGGKRFLLMGVLFVKGLSVATRGLTMDL